MRAAQPKQNIDYSAVGQGQSFQGTNALLKGASDWQDATAKQMEDERNAYTAVGSPDTYYGTGVQEALGKAATDPNAYGLISSRLNSTAAPQAEAYKENIQLNSPVIQALQSPASMANYLKSQGGTGYTSGMSKLDQMLMARNPDFQKGKSDILARQAQLQKQLSDTSDTIQGTKQSAIQGAYDTATQGIQKNLAGQESDLLSGIDAKVAAENAARQAETGNAEDLKSVQAAALSKLLQEQPGLAQNIQTAAPGVDPSKYFSAAGQVGRGDVMSPDEMAKINQLLSIYNPQNMTQFQANPTGLGQRYNFGDTDYKAAILQAAQGLAQKQQAVADEKAHQDKIAAAQAASEDKRKHPSLNPNEGTGGMDVPPGWDTGPYMHDVTNPATPVKDLSTAADKIQTGYDKWRKRH